MLEFIQVATGKLPVKARFIIVVCTYCKRINKVSIIIIIIIGVLQGDCLSPLLFNFCFNTFVQHI